MASRDSVVEIVELMRFVVLLWTGVRWAWYRLDCVGSARFFVEVFHWKQYLDQSLSIQNKFLSILSSLIFHSLRI